MFDHTTGSTMLGCARGAVAAAAKATARGLSTASAVRSAVPKTSNFMTLAEHDPELHGIIAKVSPSVHSCLPPPSASLSLLCSLKWSLKRPRVVDARGHSLDVLWLPSVVKRALVRDVSSHTSDSAW